MADKNRWRWGETNPIMSAVNSATVIAIGDLVYLDTDDVKPASDLTYLSSLALSQEAFHDAFMGVAMQRSRAADTDNIRVATDGVFEFDCASATFEVGDLIGVDDNAGGIALEDQQVIAVATANLAIGKVAQREASAMTRVRVRIFSTVMVGGVQAAA